MKNNKDEKIVREAVEFFLETLSKIYPDRNRLHDILKKKRITYTGFTSLYFLADNIGQILYQNRKCTFGKNNTTYEEFSRAVQTRCITKNFKKDKYYIYIHDVSTYYSSIKYVIQYCKIQDGTIIKTPYEFFTIRNDSKIGKIDI